MSNTGQSNGKKSSNNSAVNTPASTPVMNGNLPPSTQCSPPLNNNAPNAPKYGTLVPNRIFVGGISASTTEGDLMQLFSMYGTVKAAKIIQDRAGVSKGYGFITFENEDDARRPLRDSDNIILKERKLNIAPAIKKQPFGIRAPPPVFDGCPPGPGASPAPAPPPPIFFPPATGPYFQAYYVPPPPPPTQAHSHVPVGAQDQQHAQTQSQQVYQAPTVYPAQTAHPQAAAYPSMMFPQPIYMPQQYPAMAMPFDYAVYTGTGGVPGGAPPNFGPSLCTPNNSSASQGPCYSTAAYATGPSGPTEALFYNPTMQVFHTGGTIDPTGSAIYAAAEASFDLGAHLAQYAEDTVISADQTTEVPPSAAPTFSQAAAAPIALQSPPPERNSATPVVSVLHLDKQQERDFASMQGGRRPRPHQPSSPLSRPPPPMNGFVQYNGAFAPRYHNGPVNRFRFRRNFQQFPERSVVNSNFAATGSTEESRQQRTPPPRPPAPYSPLDKRIQHQRNMSFHLASHPSQVPPPQAVFSPPMRKPQRSKQVRPRCPPPPEIGAGDAPLPLSSPEDVAAKVDALKI